MTHLVPGAPPPALTLFPEGPDRERRRRLEGVVADVQDRFGRGAGLTRAALLDIPKRR